MFLTYEHMKCILPFLNCKFKNFFKKTDFISYFSLCILSVEGAPDGK